MIQELVNECTSPAVARTIRRYNISILSGLAASFISITMVRNKLELKIYGFMWDSSRLADAYKDRPVCLQSCSFNFKLIALFGSYIRIDILKMGSCFELMLLSTHNCITPE